MTEKEAQTRLAERNAALVYEKTIALLEFEENRQERVITTYNYRHYRQDNYGNNHIEEDIK
jgi:hypothetical protein